MEGERSTDEVLSPKKTSIDDIIDHITADLQSYDGKYILLGQPSNSNGTQSIWQQCVTRQPENLDYTQDGGSNNPYVEQQQQQTRINRVDSNLFYPSNNSTYVDNSRNNYVPYVFNNSSQYQSNTSDSPYNNYPVFYQQNSNQNTDYGLFSSPQQTNSYQNRHLIENLVGNWVPNQNGTYSPFGGGSSTHVLDNRVESNIGIQHTAQQTQHSPSSNLFSKLGNSTLRRPRMVAEVRPMRPTYSDVLAKSVTQSTSSTTNGAPAKMVVASKVEPTRNKAAKSKKGEHRRLICINIFAEN